ncbi:Cys-tRNA(Pro) deacylase [Phycicoccus sp. M110.8]|uniref:Cys-tRNA(Pro) deacylase n=1 Tax=Phycicoccus sp. M110.8 TaxID=3075433 RepID=UPI0028FD4784|nr:Cys-tRNA(Pro) deacylase [Phycicoccus sp. M110.8]MDU0315580.1 Cys-tRNA(Pro) deacylase [Phycicoccus sp. M110.8]HET8767821.1 Cys-tRNA(Pro) deacylase [Pedococcus sp.]
MAKRREAAGTPATTTLTRLGVAYDLHPYEHDPAAPSYGLEAAEALGVPPAHVFKTLLVQGERGLAVGVVPVDRTLDLKAVAAALGLKKVSMADPAAAERSTGYVVGGISPVGQKRPLPTVVDESAASLDRVYVSGGRRGLDLSLDPADLVRVTGGSFAPIAR